MIKAAGSLFRIGAGRQFQLPPDPQLVMFLNCFSSCGFTSRDGAPWHARIGTSAALRFDSQEAPHG
jgi:hypothetical protein